MDFGWPWHHFVTILSSFCHTSGRLAMSSCSFCISDCMSFGNPSGIPQFQTPHMSWIPGDIQLYPHLSLYIPHIWKMHGNPKLPVKWKMLSHWAQFCPLNRRIGREKSRTPDWLEKTRVSCRFSQQSTPDWSWMDCSAVWCSLRLMRSSNKANLGRRRNELDDGFDQPQRCPKIDKKLGDIGSSNNPVSTVFLSFEGKPFCCEDQTHSFNKPYAPRNRQLKLVMTNT